MRNESIFLVAALFFIPAAVGVVSYNGSDDGFHIMKEKQNSTSFNAELSIKNISASNPENSISKISFRKEEKYKVQFEGKIISPNPCQTIDYTVNRNRNRSYLLNVEIVEKKRKSNGLCSSTGRDNL